MHPLPKTLLRGSLAAAFFFAAALPALAADTVRPVVGAASPESAMVGTAVRINASVSDDASGIATCRLYVDNEDAGAMNASFGTAEISFTFWQAGVHTIFVFCRDNANNFNSGPSTAIFATAAPSSGGGASSPATVGKVAPLTAAAGVPVTVSANVTDAASCMLLVNAFSAGSMTLASGIASRPYMFESSGSYLVYAQCFNEAGNSTSGPEATVIVSEHALSHSELIKAACPANTGSDHPCKAVYYRGADGKRHAFPNSKVYFTWYADFSSVKEVSAEELAAAPLGKQVTYRPGSKLVKFTTVNKVYAVAKGGTLRWIKSEAVASALYGADWNKKRFKTRTAFSEGYTSLVCRAQNATSPVQRFRMPNSARS